MSARSPGRTLAIVGAAVVVAVLAVALYTIGPPSVQRAIRLDDRRVTDLRHIVTAIDSRVQAGEGLPSDLASLAKQPGLALAIVDPVSGAPYGFERIAPRAYRLCADFQTDTAQLRDGRAYVDDAWRHGAGRRCFEQRLDARKAAEP